MKNDGAPTQNDAPLKNQPPTRIAMCNKYYVLKDGGPDDSPNDAPTMPSRMEVQI